VLATLMTSALFAPLGCVADEGQSSIIVLGAVPLEADAPCEAPSSSSVWLNKGVLDVAFSGTAMTQPAVIQNQLNGQQLGQLANIANYEVRLSEQVTEIWFATEDAGSLGHVDYTLPMASISVAPGTSQGIFLEVPSSIVDEIRDRVTAQFGDTVTVPMLMKTRIRGLRSGTGTGKELESRLFEFPFDVCFGCLRACLPTLASQDDGMGNTVETDLCTADACANNPGISGGICGNAYGAPVYPACCTGVAEDTPASACI
ncbi:MAG: hypothetical protein ACPHRO_13760, partial [Nannocystaceae bacterium]